ncbi:MAG: cupin domain-containing protein [Planctomycetota bacterium]|jgi:quercetin dioxygenase-like cupin family protein
MEPHFPPSINALPRYEGPLDAHKLKAENCEVLFASYPAKLRIEPHSHPTENHGVITAGELILQMDGEERAYKTGDWYYIPSERSHAARFEVDTHVIEFWFESR